jgi:hypothetical protein
MAPDQLLQLLLLAEYQKKQQQQQQQQQQASQPVLIQSAAPQIPSQTHIPLQSAQPQQVPSTSLNESPFSSSYPAAPLPVAAPVHVPPQSAEAPPPPFQ